jgi:hypothetical protein
MLAQELHRPVQERQTFMLKVQRTANGGVVFALSGRLEADGLRELSTLLALESSGRPVTLELQDLLLVDRDAVEFLRACELKGIVLRNCPQYIRIWMASDGRSRAETGGI